MSYSNIAKTLWLPFVMFVLFMTAVIFRPLFPIDETRYMTVAWEMYLRHDWLKPLSVNFEPYHHKPPLLFWLINLSWSIFGVSRWAALIPVALSSLATVYLTITLGSKLIYKIEPQRIALLMVGSLPFVIYSTLVMFDLTLTCFILLSLNFLAAYGVRRKPKFIFLTGLFLGLAVLTKGPVAYLYIIFPMITGPKWVLFFKDKKTWYQGCAIAVLISVIPVVAWLIPVMEASDRNFMYWLVWEQTAGRVAGNFNASHARPVWFYMPFLPALFMPWIFFPAFWRGLSNIKAKLKENEGLRFLVLWTVPVFICFSLISGKQPHYLIPLLPGVALLAVYLLEGVQTKTLAKAAAGVVMLCVIGQIIAAQTVFKKYTLEPIAEIIKVQPTRELAFVRNYHGEVGFTARRERPVDDRQREEIEQWFKEHPKGWAVIRFNKGEEHLEGLKEIYSYPYRGKYIGVFEK